MLQEEARPWEQLTELVRQGDPEAISRFIGDIPAGERPRLLSRLGEDDRATVLRGLGAAEAAGLVEVLPDVQAAGIIGRLEPREAVEILAELPSNEQADLLSEIHAVGAEAILAAMEPDKADEARQLADYPHNVAGGLMATEFLFYREDVTCGEIAKDLHRKTGEYADYQLQYVYVVSAAQRLVGVLRLRDLLFTPDHQVASKIMIREPLRVRGDTSLEELGDLFARHSFLGVPVVSKKGRLLGVIHRAAVEKALGQKAEVDHLKSRGIVGGEEFRSMPLRFRSLKRLSWLSINIVLNLIAASVIALYQETLSAVIALAIFLPIISDMSGCAGTQAVAVSMRELALGLVKPHEVFYVWAREVSVGIINGLVLGLLIAGVAWLWTGNPYLGLVVGGGLAANNVVGVSVGGTIPMILKRQGLDPALASGPILSTVTDMCGFFFVLSMADALLPKLTG